MGYKVTRIVCPKCNRWHDIDELRPREIVEQIQLLECPERGGAIAALLIEGA